MQSILPLLTALLLPHRSTRAQSSSVRCSCSPTRYTFRLSLSSSCDSSTIAESKPGIDGSLCFFGEGVADGGSVLPGGAGEALQEMVQGGAGGFGPVRGLTRRSGAPDVPIREVTSVLFLELDATPELNVINADSTRFSTNLTDGSTVTFASVSSGLDPSSPLGEQADKVPGGVVVVLFGTDEEGGAVQNTVAWGYGGEGDCESEPLGLDDAIGWIAIDEYTSAMAAFCPAVEAPPPTPSPIETASPSVASIVTQSPTAAEVIETVTTTSTATTTAEETSVAASAAASETPFSKSGKGTKLFKEGKSSKTFSKASSSNAMSVSGELESEESMSMNSVAETGKGGKAAKLFRSKSSSMSVAN